MAVMDYSDLWVEDLPLNGIVVPERLRQVNNEKVATLAESMREIGLRVPIMVRLDGEGEPTILVVGRHRLEAARELGWQKIACIVDESADETDARLWEIAENLHRAELTALERSAHIAEWIKLTESRRISAQTEPKMARGRPESGIKAAARDLGVERNEAQRAVKIDGLSPEAKEAARELGLDDNQSALLAAANTDAADEQIKTLKQRKERKPRASRSGSSDNVVSISAVDRQVNAIMEAWNKAAKKARGIFLSRIDGKTDAYKSIA